MKQKKLFQTIHLIFRSVQRTSGGAPESHRINAREALQTSVQRRMFMKTTDGAFSQAEAF